MRIGSIIIFHLRKLWKAKFSILCNVIFLVGLQGKFDIDHSWEWKGWFTHTTQAQERKNARLCLCLCLRRPGSRVAYACACAYACTCIVTSNITWHSMKNLAFHSLLRWKMIIVPILTTTIHFSLKGCENLLFELGNETVNNQYSILTGKLVRCSYRNLNRSLHSRWNFISTFTEFTWLGTNADQRGRQICFL